MRPRSLRVLRLAPVLDFGGVESCMVVQSKYWDDAETTVDYACFWEDGTAANEIRSHGHRVINLGVDPSIRNSKATLALLKLLRREHYDVIHSSIGDANFHAMLCAPFGPWKTIIEEAGIPNRRLRNRLIHGALYRLPDKIVCVSQASADNIIQNEWAPKDKIQVVPNAIDAKHFDVVHHRKPDRKLFRAIGRLTPVKNFDGLIRAFAEAQKHVPDIRLEIIGEGEERGRLEALVEELALNDVVSLPGFMKNIDELHRSTGWLLIPSHREGFGLVAAEAMAASVPTIASRVGGLPEVFGELSEQWTIPSTTKSRWHRYIIRAAIMSSDSYSALSEHVRQNAARFHPDDYVRTLVSHYKEVSAGNI